MKSVNRKRVRLGDVYNRFTIICEVEKQGGKRMFKCRCRCGNEKNVRLGNLTKGISKSCGCLCKEIITTHGLCGTRIHDTWRGIMKRCNNPNEKSYKYYGGRGIRVCKRWYNISNFYKDMGQPDKGESIERIDNNGNYEPSNCKWATIIEQANNKRNNRLITIDGKTNSMAQWCRELGRKYGTVQGRIYIGWTEERALTTPTTVMDSNGNIHKP